MPRVGERRFAALYYDSKLKRSLVTHQKCLGLYLVGQRKSVSGVLHFYLRIKPEINIIIIAKLILAHFSVDNSLALVKRSAFIDKESEIMVWSEYQVKEGTKIYDAKIIEIGESL